MALVSEPTSETWDQTVAAARQHVGAEGKNPNQLSTVQLLSPKELEEVNRHLARPMYQRVPWDRWDWLVAFGAGLTGGLIDVFLGTPGHFAQAAMADKDHLMGSWMEGIHGQHGGAAPIDYQGPHFGGGSHRGLTSGHDLFRPLEGIGQFKDGTFRGWYFHDGIRVMVESTVNQNGVPYEPMSWGSAALAWMVHNACDFFSSASLPIPGTSWLYESESHDVRRFVQEDLYKQGINLRHVALQTLAPLAVKVAVGSYFFLRYRNLDAPAAAKAQKRAELGALAHGVSLGINLGKIAVMKNPLLLNVPQLIATMRSLFGLIVLEHSRNSFIRKFKRNAGELAAAQDELEMLLKDRLPGKIVLT
jgi:hypothetical protein